MSPAPDDKTTRYSRARLARDARFDGLFYVAVKTTGIYCRPICPAPAAKESNVCYYEHAAAAAASGYRPCLRCRPELAPGLAPCDSGERIFELARQRIRDGALGDSSLVEVARSLGVGERQLRRLFVDRLGVAPSGVHATQRLLLAKQLLTDTRLPVTDIAYASGYHSLRRFNQAFLDGCGMPPSRLRLNNRPTTSDTLELDLTYRPPHDFCRALAFLAARAIPGVERVDSTRYWRVIGPAESPGWISVEQSRRENALRLRIHSRQLGQLPDLLRRVRRLFDLDAQPGAVDAVLSADSRLAESVRRAAGLRVIGAFDGFETAARAVLGQQISVAAARTLSTRLVETWGTSIVLEDGSHARIFPTPSALTEASLQSIGLTAARASTLRALADATHSRRVDLETAQPLAVFVRELCELPGIGPWTAHYVAMRCLHHPDAFPASDLVVRQQLGGASPVSTAQAEALSEAWRPWRAYAVMHLWNMANEARRSRR